MTRRSLIALGLALVFGIAAAVGVRSIAVGPRQSAPNTVPVVLAAVDLGRGSQLMEEHLYMKDWPADLVPPGAFTNLEEAKERSLLSSVVKDEPLMQSKVSEKGKGGGIDRIIAKGMRAYTISTPDAASGVAGFILPGTHVDILLTVTDRAITERVGGGSTVTLLQNVEVLAVNQELDAPSENRVEGDKLRSVTLQVVPEDAAKLSLAQTKGTLHLSMRNSQDEEAGVTCPITMRELQFMEEDDIDVAGLAVPGGVRRMAKPIRIMTYRGNSASYVFVRPSLPVVKPTPPAPEDIASATTPVSHADDVQ